MRRELVYRHRIFRREENGDWTLLWSFADPDTGEKMMAKLNEEQGGSVFRFVDGGHEEMVEVSRRAS